MKIMFKTIEKERKGYFAYKITYRVLYTANTTLTEGRVSFLEPCVCLCVCSL